jgi:hypothetical protein
LPMGHRSPAEDRPSSSPSAACQCDEFRIDMNGYFFLN